MYLHDVPFLANGFADCFCNSAVCLMVQMFFAKGLKASVFQNC